MKKTLCKALSIFLATLMLLTVTPVFSLAAEPTVPVPSITVTMLSETQDEVVLMVSLTENSFSSLDLKITAADDLTLTNITVASIGATAKNEATGMIGIASTTPVVAPQDVATYTYTKATPEGITADDFTVEILTCYVEIDDAGEDIFESVTVKNEVPAIHTHTAAVDWVTTLEPTCGAEGTKVHYCSVCGEIAESLPIEATGNHANTTIETVEATCTEDGYTKVICSDCKQTISTTTITATGHVDTHIERTEPTCTEDGVEKVICACGEVVSSTVLNATGHVNTHIERTEPTCTEDGVEKVICACGEVVSSTVLNATGHINTHIERTEPTCTEDGVEKVICACGEVVSSTVLSATGHVNTHIERTEPTCTVDGIEKVICACGEVVNSTVIPAKGHGEEKTIRKAATCTEDGYIRNVCTVCGDTVREQILAAPGHNPIVDTKLPTCTESGYTQIICTGCQEVTAYEAKPATGHKWLAWQTVKEPTYAAVGLQRRFCDNCGTDQEREIPKLVLKANEIVLRQEEISMNFKQTARLFASVLPEEAAYSTEIIWESSNESVATVDENGAVYAAGLGTATITAKTADGTVEATCTVTVKYSVLQWIIVYLLFGWLWYI